MAKLYWNTGIAVLAMQEAATRRAEEARLAEEERRRSAAYVQLNNLYLAVECGLEKLTITVANRLRCLVPQVYGPDDPMIEYWDREFQLLPRWCDV